MKIRLDLSLLNKAVNKMGAQDKAGFILETKQDVLKVLLDEIKKGLEIDIDDLNINQGGLLSFKDKLGNDHHVLLYIKDHQQYLQKALDRPGGGNKFHVADCQTLQRMKTQGRFNRYVVTNDVSGVFEVCGYDVLGRWRESERVTLYVCQNCLKKLHYKNFPWKSSAEKNHFVKNFDLSEFFSTYSSYFSELPEFAAGLTSGHGYTDDWPKVSEHYRTGCGWKCEECGIYLENFRYLLHVHHRNGIKTDNRKQNLRALCADCHSKQPGHVRLHVSHEARKRIQRLRHEQLPADRLNNSLDEVFKRLIDEHIPINRLSISWDEAFKYADPAVHDLLNVCKRRQDFSVPEIGYEAMDKNGIYAQIELAWEKEKLGVAIELDDGVQHMIEQGWRIMTVPQAIQEWG